LFSQCAKNSDLDSARPRCGRERGARSAIANVSLGSRARTRRAPTSSRHTTAAPECTLPSRLVRKLCSLPQRGQFRSHWPLASSAAFGKTAARHRPHAGRCLTIRVHVVHRALTWMSRRDQSCAGSDRSDGVLARGQCRDLQRSSLSLRSETAGELRGSRCAGLCGHNDRLAQGGGRHYAGWCRCDIPARFSPRSASSEAIDILPSVAPRPMAAKADAERNARGTDVRPTSVIRRPDDITRYDAWAHHNAHIGVHGLELTAS